MQKTKDKVFRLMILVTIAVATACLQAGIAQEEELVINGLGEIVLREGKDGLLTFICEDVERAELFQNKLWHDLSWDKLCGPQQKSRSGVQFLQWQGYGVLALPRKKNLVMAVPAKDVQQLEDKLRANRLSGADFNPDSSSRPLWLDFFDLQSLSMYHLALHRWDASGWKTYEFDVLNDKYEFWNDFNFGAGYHNGYFSFQGRAPGTAHVFPYTYDVGLARRNGQGVCAHFGIHGLPWWMANAYPRDIATLDPYVIPGWNPLRCASSRVLSAGASDEALAEGYNHDLKVLDAIKEAAGESLACLRFSAGRPGDELGLHHYSTDYIDYGPAAQNLFRKWLQTERGSNLKELGQRWYGDPAHFGSWQDVTIPSQVSFFGGFGEETLSLLDGWYRRTTEPGAGWTSIGYQPDRGWDRTELVPSLKQLFLPGQGKAAWFRKEFEGSRWLQERAGQEIYLVLMTQTRVNRPVSVWINGHDLGGFTPSAEWCGPIGMRVTDLIRPGQNVICLKVPESIIHGPVFLTTQKPKRYPYLGRHGNARWIDLRDWQVFKLLYLWKKQAEVLKPRAPEVPLMFVPGGAWELADFIPELKEKFGVSSLQHTGGGSSYFPWWCGLGYPLGVYGSSEEGNTMTDPERQSHQLGWSLINGEGHHIYFHNSSHYIQMEKETGWFTKNRRLLEIYGKARWKKPRVAVLMSSLMARYFPYQNLPHGLDIGRGALQAAHYNNVYATESMVIDGIVDSYPVLFDDGTSVMSDELVAALERYVRGGGTFVAVSNTGRHSLVEADAWPIERLSGYQVLGERKDMKLTVLPGNPLLKTLAGRSFQGSGRAINWLGQNEVPESVAMEPKGEQNTGEYETIARWSDGTVAVGMRRLGKGRVVVLGSSFWRSMDDTEGKGLLKIGPLQTVFLRDLLSGLGVSHQIDCSSERVWARRFITKNGLQEWMILYNRGSASAGDVHLTFTWPEPLDSVKDIVTGADVPVSYKDGEVHIHGLDIEPAQVKVFGVDRGDFSGAVQHWYRSKARYMTPPAVDKKPVPKPEVSQRSIVLDEFYFRKLKENDSGWLDEPVTQQSWNVVSYGFWDEMGYEPKGKCVYRTEFQLPENWKDRRVVLAFLSHDSPIFLQNATVYLNGKEVGSYQGQRWSNNEILEVTSFLKDGTNKVAFLVEAKEIRGGYLGQVVLYPLQDIGPSFDLEEWKIVGPGDENGSVTLPVSRKVQHLTCEVDVPKDWPSDRILLQWKGEMGLRGRNIALVVVNGRGIAYNSYAHPFGNIFQINLYPWIKPGERNTIQLWPLACIPSRGGLCAPNVYDVKIGVESPLKDR